MATYTKLLFCIVILAIVFTLIGCASFGLDKKTTLVPDNLKLKYDTNLIGEFDNRSRMGIELGWQLE